MRMRNNRDDAPPLLLAAPRRPFGATVMSGASSSSAPPGPSLRVLFVRSRSAAIRSVFVSAVSSSSAASGTSAAASGGGAVGCGESWIGRRAFTTSVASVTSVRCGLAAERPSSGTKKSTETCEGSAGSVWSSLTLEIACDTALPAMPALVKVSIVSCIVLSPWNWAPAAPTAVPACTLESSASTSSASIPSSPTPAAAMASAAIERATNELGIRRSFGPIHSSCSPWTSSSAKSHASACASSVRLTYRLTMPMSKGTST